MEKFKQLIFIDDDTPTNIYHEIIVGESGLCEESKFFNKATEAIANFKELITKENFQLPEIIFLDINMPMMNGWEFIEAYRKLEIQQRVTIILLTTSLYDKDIDRAEGIDLIYKVMNKPLEEDQLLQVRKEYLELLVK